MNELLAFGLGLACGVGFMWSYTRHVLQEVELLKTQTRILAATIADNFMDLEEARDRLKQLEKDVNGLTGRVN